MGQNNQKDQKGPKMTAAVMLVQNNSESAFFLGHPVGVFKSSLFQKVHFAK